MATPAPVPIDGQYLERVDGRIAGLQRYEIATRQDILRTQQQLVRTTADIELEMEALKRELVELDRSIRDTAARIKGAVGQFKSVVKKGDLVRLQNRADMWAPEKRITREQFKRLLRDEF